MPPTTTTPARDHQEPRPAMGKDSYAELKELIAQATALYFCLFILGQLPVKLALLVLCEPFFDQLFMICLLGWFVMVSIIVTDAAFDWRLFLRESLRAAAAYVDPPQQALLSRMNGGCTGGPLMMEHHDKPVEGAAEPVSHLRPSRTAPCLKRAIQGIPTAFELCPHCRAIHMQTISPEARLATALRYRTIRAELLVGLERDINELMLNGIFRGIAALVLFVGGLFLLL